MGSSSQKYIIVKDRVEIYKDFALNLLYYIQHYYIDRESLNSDEDIRNHYNWCFKKVCDEFMKEGIDFSKNKELREYFYVYYYHQFYKIVGIPGHDTSVEYYEKFWKSIFDIEKQKNKNIINILIEIYNIYDKSINQEKNILEIV
jgi:predicted transcriptional regulator